MTTAYQQINSHGHWGGHVFLLCTCYHGDSGDQQLWALELISWQLFRLLEVHYLFHLVKVSILMASVMIKGQGPVNAVVAWTRCFVACCFTIPGSSRQSCPTFPLNYVVLLIEKKDQEGQCLVLSVLEVAEQENLDIDSKYWALLAIGTLTLEGSMKKIVLVFDVESMPKWLRFLKKWRMLKFGADIELLTKQNWIYWSLAGKQNHKLDGIWNDRSRYLKEWKTLMSKPKMSILIVLKLLQSKFVESP